MPARAKANPAAAKRKVAPKRAPAKRAPVRKRATAYAAPSHSRAAASYGIRMGATMPHSLQSHSMFDAGRASATDTLHVPMSFGNYLPLQAITRESITTNSPIGSKTFVIVQFTATNCSLFKIDGTTGVITQVGSSQLANSSPNQVRILRQSLQIVNTSVFTNACGTVRCVSIPEPINWQYTTTTAPTVSAGTLTTIQNIVATNPATKTYSASELLQSHTWVIPPSSFQSYIEYFDFQILSAAGVQTANALSFNYPPQTNSSGVFGPPPACMNTLVVEFNQTASTNTYDLTLYQELAAKFSADTIYQNLHITPKYTSMDNFQKHALVVSKTASAGVQTDDLMRARDARGRYRGRSSG